MDKMAASYYSEHYASHFGMGATESASHPSTSPGGVEPIQVVPVSSPDYPSSLGLPPPPAHSGGGTMYDSNAPTNYSLKPEPQQMPPTPPGE